MKLLESKRTKDSVDLTKADVIVSGGFGIGKEGFELLKKLVVAIRKGGQKVELGASRAAVDAGIIEYEYQVGQTGKTVRPTVYIAVGISGAIQHIAGMQDSATVIAINNDPSAKIFNHADFGIVGDYKETIPELIRKVKKDVVS
ncbi:MAG: electron transfer flavoprotein subunit alpha/FixB family protein [Candidatus Kariarchaeaceae archaeon]